MPRVKYLLLLIAVLILNNSSPSYAGKIQDIETLQNRQILDDYESNVLFGYNIINDTQKYASRYVGNSLNCTDCHREAGALANQFPLNIAGIYPQWRAKSSQLTSLSLKIRECFVNSINGIMPPANAPEITAIKTYIHFLSKNQLIGQVPEGRHVPVLKNTGHEPNPVTGQRVYQQFCAHCHGADGSGLSNAPAVWGFKSYASGSGMNDINNAAYFIKEKLSQNNISSLSTQQAFDVAAFLKQQIRGADPKKQKVSKLLYDFAIAIGLISTKNLDDQ